MRRKLLLLALAVAALLVGGGLTARHLLVGYLTPDFLVRQIEQQLNCRAHIDGVKVSLFGNTAVEVNGLSLAPRDTAADEARPLAARDPLAEGTAEIRCESVTLAIRPAELIRQQFHIRELIVTGVSVATRIDDSGDASIERLFDRPKKGKAPEAEAPETAPVTKPARKPMPLQADRIELRKGQADFRVEKSGAGLRIEDMQVAITEIDVEPADLPAHNRAQFQLSGTLVVLPPADAAGSDDEYLRGRFTASGEATPFHAGSGRMDPAWSADITLHEGSQINTFPVIAQLQALLEGVDTAGVDLKDINIRGTLLSDAQTRVSHAQGRYHLEKPLPLELPDTLLQIGEGSWLDTGANQHQVQGVVIASEPLTKKIEGKVEAYIAKKARGFPADSLRNLVLGPVTKEGRLTIEFTSRGDLSKPVADIVTPFGNLTEVIGTGKDTLKTLEAAGKSLLKNLFGK